MFRAASRRASAHAAKLLQPQPKSLARSIHINSTTRPTLQPRINNGKPLASPYISGTRHLTILQKISRKYREASKGIWRKNPILMPLAIFSVVGGAFIFAYISYVEVTRVGPQYHKFPPPVADALRTAVYYTEIDLNPAKAMKAYREALHIAFEMGIHPYSDEILGIKLQVAMMLEKAGLVKPAIDVLERTKHETLAWVDEVTAGNAAAAAEKVKQAQAQAQVQTEVQTTSNVQVDTEAIRETEEDLKARAQYETRQRDKALKKVVGIAMKLGELYSSEYIQDEKKAEAAQVAAVEICLKEMHRRQRLGLPVGSSSSGEGSEGEAWLNLTEIATALAELAATYTAKERYELAMPLYMRALDLIRAAEGTSISCKQVVLLNDVATALVGQVQVPAKSQPQQPVAAQQTVEAAQKWAEKAIEVAAHIKPPLRDEECDITCVVATYNLGELAELQKKPEVAKQRYTEAKALADGIGYEEGSTMAQEALKRLGKK
ncbi:Tetratricopeptide-like helical [Penicillium griseofulvum]|uniref:Tetratricopeptide-like helical n=1 Tax=Penicillium patulum TaxID=5078 RepID=A0A135LVX2_PENPA|nr:Tetratricopeptide-like helical [Penicillium griseofulvum]KXG53106.1 Tetratricopeptide-like helical [Penicillium griseofulvum]